MHGCMLGICLFCIMMFAIYTFESVSGMISKILKLYHCNAYRSLTNLSLYQTRSTSL
jgi:hypothetical protein